jgi:hypothetical protein
MRYRARTLCLVWWAACAIGSGAAHAADPAPCNLTRAAEIPAKMDGGNLLVKIQIAGHDAWMKIGTREPYSLISRQMAVQLKLRFHDQPGLKVRDEANQEIKHMVQVPSLSLGTLQAADLTFLVQGENTTQVPPWDGIIGINILASYDVEIDPAHNIVSLFLPNRCSGQAAYWTRDFQTIPFTLRMSELDFQVPLENKMVKATLDTSSADTTLRPEAAHDLFELESEANGAAPDGETITSTGFSLPFHRHRFTSFDIGGVGFRNTEIGVISEKMRIRLAEQGLMNVDAVVRRSQSTPLAIGMHHLSHLRFMIAFAEGLLYVSAADAN